MYLYLKGIFLLILITIGSESPAQPIISEFMAQNDTVLADEDGMFSDWIEIYNPGPGSLNLDGYYLTDDASNLTKWRFPSQVVTAGGYLVVFASGKNRAVAGAQLHASFALDADGEYLALVATNGSAVLSSFGATYPKQYRDISYGFQTQGTNPTLRTGQAGYLISHTPGAANTVIPGPHPLYCDTSLARIEITASQAVWDGLQATTPTVAEGSVNVRFRHGDIDVTVTNAGISARGNTALTKYPRSFNISFDSFVPGQNLFGIEKLNLNSEANDPAMARSKLSFDLSQAAGLPTEYANHVATVIIGPNNHRSGPNGVFFDAVLNNTQPVEDAFIKQRFPNSRGNLYKCTYTASGPADLTYKGPTGSSYSGLSTYELKYQGSPDASYDDLAGFINIINNTPSNTFPAVIRRNFEVDDFLKRLALDVLTSNWDGYWGNYNNFHLYRDPGSGKWHYLPYDMDNTFSIRWITPSSGNWATQNIYTWGHTSSTPLASRILGVPEFKNRYSYYLNQMLQTIYQNSTLNPLVYRVRENQTAALPFDNLGITNCKSTERSRYSGDWPNWTYTQYFNSFDQAQVSFNGNVPNYHGITEFITARRTNALNQLTLSNIGPIISDLSITPALPATNQPVLISAHVEDDMSVSAVKFISRFNTGASSTNNMFDDGLAPDAIAGDKIYTAQIGPFASAGQLTYYLQATDNANKATFEPWGGAADTNSLTIGSPYLGLAITELNYHPHEPTGGELGVSGDPGDYEFLELQNLGSTTLNLNGVKFIAGITYTFPSQTLAAEARTVIVKNLAAFTARYGNGINISGAFGGQLSNDGEELHLVDPNGATIRRFTFQNTPPWPARADGKGSSLELMDPSAKYSDGTNWHSSLNYGGSPGASGLTLPAGIVINEVLTHTDPPLYDSIELYNPTASAINIGGWYLSDSDTPYKKFRIPGGTMLSAGGYLTFDETNHFNKSLGANTNDFSLDAAHGDDVWLLQANAQSNLVAFVDHVSFGSARNGESFGRWPNGQGKLQPMLTRTFGTANSGPRVGPVIISEFMYQLASGDPTLEFVEILNTGASTENLGGWKLTGNVDYTFPPNTFLSPGQVLLVLPFDPKLPANSSTLTAFCAHYGMGTNMAAVGAYLGSLSDTGDTLRLLRPDEPPAEEPAFTPMLLEDEVTYASALPWPTAAAGSGPSLQRRGPVAWGNDPLNWMVASVQLATPGTPPLADRDGDGLPDCYEIETYGSTNVVGSSVTGDTDGDGASDIAEYVAGTIATNAESNFQINVTLLPADKLLIQFNTAVITGPGYFGFERRYTLEQTTNLGNPASWIAIPGYTNLTGIGLVVYTNSITNAFWSTRACVSLQ
jgi:spore coat protein CotH